MDTLVLNGKSYVRASKAAKNLGYTSDYVGQLCRSGNVDAHLVGRTWYVHEEELGAHRVEKKRNARVKAREQAHKTLEEYKVKAVPETQNSYKKLAIRYEPDEKELIPTVEKKLSVQADKPEVIIPEGSDNDTGGYEIENPGKKVIMSGTLTVIDAEEQELYAGYTVLTPKIQRKKRNLKEENTQTESPELTTASLSVESEDPDLEVAPKIGFAERLALEGIEKKDEFEESPLLASEDSEENFVQSFPEDNSATTSPEGNDKGGNGGIFVLLCTVVFVLSLASLTLESHIFSSSKSVSSKFVPNFEETISFIRSKI